MTEPFLQHPKDYTLSTLEANPKGAAIVSVSSGGTPSTKNGEYWGGNIPWLTPKEICYGRSVTFVSKTERSITQKGLEKSGAKIQPPGTVMLTKRAPVGTAVLNTVPMTNNQGFLNFRCGADLDPVYLCFWFRANKPYLETVANGSTYLELYPGDLFEFVIGYPRIDEQRAVVRSLLSLELAVSLGEVLETTADNLSRIDKIQRETQFLTSIKDEILIRLMSGEIRLKDLRGNSW